MDKSAPEELPSYDEAVRKSMDSTRETENLDSKTPFPEEKADQKTTPPQDSESPAEEKRSYVPSHSPLAFANYPPLWSADAKPKHNPRSPASASATASSSKPSTSRTQSGFSAATLSSVMSPGSKDPKAKKFEDKDDQNRHRYAKKERTVSGLHFFGRDIGGLSGGPPGLSFKRQKGK